jgi:hypothetical protein
LIRQASASSSSRSSSEQLLRVEREPLGGGVGHRGHEVIDLSTTRTRNSSSWSMCAGEFFGDTAHMVERGVDLTLTDRSG